MSYEGERPHMEAWAEKKMRVGGTEEIEAYVAKKNAESIDGLPAFDGTEVRPRCGRTSLSVEQPFTRYSMVWAFIAAPAVLSAVTVNVPVMVPAVCSPLLIPQLKKPPDVVLLMLFASIFIVRSVPPSLAMFSKDPACPRFCDGMVTVQITASDPFVTVMVCSVATYAKSSSGIPNL